ncbi:PucR family transcriptional regulator [Clostridium aminobutyricum]|uniref:PucR family transcriptional regulator n=1 Tax=Clostridium aminobutyricum TaxID=33953 RepID=A0A939D905_CLOAM|nr:PucR family transcriptional regulator [Clostridium aminobutyricum]MBN7773432.1 PucR family transcriptional regulator [Clostridium aminobutyricum]
MSICVKDLFQLEVFKNFKIVAGQKGLNRRLAAAQVLDFEFVDGLENHRKVMFDKDSFVVSSLLFAKDNEQILTEAVKILFNLGISAFAYKNVIYKNLPQEIIDFANSKNLPVLEFQDEDAYFEDIIFEIMNQVKKDSRITLMEDKIKHLLQQEWSLPEVESMIDIINPNLRNKIQVFYIEMGDEQKVMNSLMSFDPPEGLRGNSIVSKYNKDFLLIISTDKEDRNLQYKFEDVLFHLGIKKDNLIMGLSSIHFDKSKIKMAIEEAIQARMVGKIENKDNINYQEIGLYQILLPEIRSEHLQKYMQNYLKPILNNGEAQNELLKTAVQYILAGGDLNQASQTLFCHKNTVRYRINKIHELIDANSNELEFFQNLAVAVKIYLINGYRH